MAEHGVALLHPQSGGIVGDRSRYPQKRYPQMPLTHFDLKNAKPTEAAYKLSDGGGLHLLVKPNGARLWRMKYRFLGKEQLLSFGAYPLFTLADARTKRDEAKRLIASGTDPSVKKKIDRLDAQRVSRPVRRVTNWTGMMGDSFLLAGRTGQWFGKKTARWISGCVS